jgi:salicylate hydroxylase
MTRPLRIAIVGAGVAGAILARNLGAIDGLDVTCLERVGRGDHQNAGTGLNIGPNAVKALTICDPALAEAVAAASLPWRSWRTSLTDGRELFNLPLSNVADNEGWRIRWAELYRVLREACEPLIHYGCTLDTIESDSADPTRTSIAWHDATGDHRLSGIDLLVGADGRYSAVRESFAGHPASDHLGVAIFRVLVPDTSGGLIDDYEQWFNGPNRLLAFRVEPDSIYIAGSFPLDGEAAVPPERRTAAALRAAYTPAEGHLGAQGRWLVEAIATHADATHWARMQDHPLSFGEAQANVLYLGDAAHGMVPTLGQGATQAIEDAAVAVTVIRAQMAAGQRVPRKWIDEIATARTDRVRFVMDFSRDASDTMLEGADPVAGSLHKTEASFIGRLRRLYRDVPMIHPSTVSVQPAQA